MKKPSASELRELVAQTWEIHGTCLGTSRALGVPRSTVNHHLKALRKSGRCVKPLVGGTLAGVQQSPLVLPGPGVVRRYLCTSAQNNTKVNEKVWESILLLAKHYEAEILVGTFSYNTNAYGKLAVKKGKQISHQSDLWFDDRLRTHFADDRRSLGNGLVWCGEMNILPTAEDPLEGLETYSGRQSALFPHAKMSLRCVAAMKGSQGVKFNYSTGTVTQKNYIQKKAGLKGEHHHNYGALLVEVNENGNWWVRQLEADEKGCIQDLGVVVREGVVTTGHRVEAITWGDLHATCIDDSVLRCALGKGEMLESLKPRYQFIHDLLEGASVNHHSAKDPHVLFSAYLRGFDSVESELEVTAHVLSTFSQRRGVQTVVVDSNHDNWIGRWLREHDYRRDPRNAVLFLDLQSAVYKALYTRDLCFNLTEYAMRRASSKLDEVKFLRADESFTICGGRIECGMHGHLGPNGARGTPANLNKVGRKANTGHTHTCEIRNGLYVAGTSTNLDMGFNVGPSAWSHSHIITYSNGKRTIVTLYAGKWRA